MFPSRENKKPILGVIKSTGEICKLEGGHQNTVKNWNGMNTSATNEVQYVRKRKKIKT